ncbi:tumor necrosis factor receptor superfamily member 25 [Mixophyes fleayi]|uniref:tumor necrosis factor receptor superfamily member 25 n=1 Tax=Mixophyes fleayi TaxID=3061075 RepID=UPI003F4D83D4
MKKVLYILLLTWAYITESIMPKNITTLDRRNQTRFYSSKVLSQGILRGYIRYKRSESNNSDLHYDEGVGRLCKKCPKGQYVEESCTADGKETKCKACPQGTYLEYSNYRTKCLRCTHCHSGTEREEASCTATSNTQCGCNKGYYRMGDLCQPCTKCHNKETTWNCSKTADAQCGQCLPGFYKIEGECQSCHEPCEDTLPSCSPQCAPVTQNPPVAYIVAGGLLLLLLPCVGLLIHKHKRKKKHSLGGHVFTVCGQGEPPNLTQPCPESNVLLKLQETVTAAKPDASPGHVTSVLQKGCTLYDIIDCVPVRRWKEFMRTLELPDKEIEMVEVEVGNFRDQQYEMLRRWCRLKLAAVESIYRALDKMNLSGCAEELRTKIEHYS